MTEAKRFIFSRRSVVAGLFATAITPARVRAQAAAFSALATTGMIGDLVRGVAGGTATVETLLGSGVDPHLYKPTRTDIARLIGAEIVFYNGLLLEGKMTDALVRVASSGRPVIAVGEGIGEDFLMEPPAFAGHYDPHVWMDVQGWIKALDVVRDRLSAFRPALAGTFAANAGALKADLEALDAYARTTLSSVPEAQRVLVTAHDAFGYLGRAYGFEVVGIQGISTESEAGLKRIAELVDLLVQRRIPAVFVETTVSERNIRALIEGAASRGHKVVIGGALFSDAMGDPGTYEGTYPGMIDHNVTAIATALGGTAPEKGFKGRLSRADR